MRRITTATAAAAIGIERKSLDNILARLDHDDAPVGRQGLERRIPVGLLPELALTAELVKQLGISVRVAHELACRLATGVVCSSGFIAMSAESDSLRAELERRLESAIESVVRRPRGRPPRKAEGG